MLELRQQTRWEAPGPADARLHRAERCEAPRRTGGPRELDGATLAALSGINSISAPACSISRAARSLEKLVVDHEICGMFSA